MTDGSVVPDAVKTRENAAAQSPRFRAMPLDVMVKTYRANAALYDGIQKQVPEPDGEPGATILLISGCQDDQLSLDGFSNGLFTENLRAVWTDGAWSGGGYAAFRDEIVARMPADQQPQYSRVGAANDGFEQQKPFTIG
jgi:hypothetical protein